MKTPDEIKKGLECCAQPGYDGLCNECPYKNDEWCGDAVKLDAIAYIEQLEDAPPKWISVDERLPGNDADVLVYIAGDSAIDIGYYTRGGYWETYAADNHYVTHWLPMPEPPKEG